MVWTEGVEVADEEVEDMEEAVEDMVAVVVAEEEAADQ